MFETAKSQLAITPFSDLGNILLLRPAMPKDVQPVLADFVRRLVGHRVSHSSLLLNSLRVCVDRQLQENSGFFLWFEPVWHLGDPNGVLVGSRQAQVEERDAHAALNSLVEKIVGQPIEGVSIEPLTNDIDVRFSGGYWIRTFVSDPTADENWYIRDCGSNEVVTGSAKGLRLTDRADRSSDTPQ
jgi:hypothetical protein